MLAHIVWHSDLRAALASQLTWQGPHSKIRDHLSLVANLEDTLSLISYLMGL